MRLSLMTLLSRRRRQVLDPRGGGKGTEDIRSVLNIKIHEQEARRDIWYSIFSMEHSDGVKALRGKL